MHRMILVTINDVNGVEPSVTSVSEAHAESSAAARQAVVEYLEEEEFGIMESRWSGGWCDGFVVGGRYTCHLLTPDDEEPPKGKWPCPTRLGNEEDAQLVTAELYERHLKPFEGAYEEYDEDGIGFVDVNNDEVNPDFIGRKWLVVVDYHN